MVPFAPEYRTIVWIATSVLLSVLFDDVAAEIDADTYPAAHQHPDNWLIVGLFYPPKPTIGDLFDAR